MATPTRPTRPNSPLSDCLRKTAFPNKREAKIAARRRPGPTEVYECLWPNRDGSPGSHWHYARRHQRRPTPSANDPA